MRRILLVLAGAALAALVTTPLAAQPVTANQVTGQECWNAGQGPGGPGQFICLNLFRSSTSNVALSAVAGSFTVGTATNTTVVSGSSAGNVVDGGAVIITAQPSAATITLPPSPVADGAVVRICNGTNSAFATNVVTVAANTNQTLVPTGAAITLTTLAANTCVAYLWVLANTSWYKVQ